MPFLKSSAPAQVYASCVRSSMIYGNETRLLLDDVGLKFENADEKNFNSLTQHQLWGQCASINYTESYTTGIHLIISSRGALNVGNGKISLKFICPLLILSCCSKICSTKSVPNNIRYLHTQTFLNLLH